MAVPSYKAERRQMDTDQQAKHQPDGVMGMGAGVVGQAREMDGQRVRYISMVCGAT